MTTEKRYDVAGSQWISAVTLVDTTGASVASVTGLLTSKIITAATTNATSVKAASGKVYGLQLSNSGAAVAFVKLYDKASAPIVGTDIPFDIIAIPAGMSREISRPNGISFLSGIAYAVTGGAADTDATAVTLNQVVGSLQYV